MYLERAHPAFLTTLVVIDLLEPIDYIGPKAELNQKVNFDI